MEGVMVRIELEPGESVVVTFKESDGEVKVTFADDAHLVFYDDELVHQEKLVSGDDPTSKLCGVCNGTGRFPPDRPYASCQTCGGSGFVHLVADAALDTEAPAHETNTSGVHVFHVLKDGSKRWFLCDDKGTRYHWSKKDKWVQAVKDWETRFNLRAHPVTRHEGLSRPSEVAAILADIEGKAKNNREGK